MLMEGQQFPAGTGSGGIGAVSAGISEALAELALLSIVAGVLVNRLVVRKVRQTRGRIEALHRAHSLVLLLLLVPAALLAAVFAGFDLPFIPAVWIALVLFAAVLLVAQFVLLVVLLVFLLKAPASSS